MPNLYPEEPPRVFIDSSGRAWLRLGYCCRCGECCRGDPFDSDSGREYCPLFRWADEKIGECTDRQHSYYLAGCIDWPTKPENIVDKPLCTYRFESVNGKSN